MGLSLQQSIPEGVFTAGTLLRQSPDGAQWCLDTVAGRFIEITGSEATGALTACAALLLEAQERGELIAWIGSRRSIFFPPDLAAAGVDLQALPVIFATHLNSSLRVVDTLIRSGSFAVVVLDLGARDELPFSVQTRLVGLAQEHQTALVYLTQRSRRSPARGSLVSLRVQTTKGRIDSGLFKHEIRAVKDKRAAPGWTYTEMCHGPDGLC